LRCVKAAKLALFAYKDGRVAEHSARFAAIAKKRRDVDANLVRAHFPGTDDILGSHDEACRLAHGQTGDYTSREGALRGQHPGVSAYCER